MKKYITSWLIAILALVSCSTITEELPLCTNQLRFCYDYNMKYADAFGVEVKKLDVFVFDDQDRFVTVFSEERESFGADFQIPLSLPEGNYHFIVWAGRHSKSYEFKEHLTPGESTPADLQTSLRCTDGVLNSELDALWHGDAHVTLTPDESKTVTINLTKDTNKFRIIVQGAPDLKDEQLNFSITDNNGTLGADNLICGDSPIKYIPYFQQIAQLDEKLNATVAELNTLRLMESNHPRLNITHADGSKIIDIDLIQYLLLTKMEGHQMDAQEYLDRQDEYSLIFFLTQDNQGNYVVMKIKVNGWVIRLQQGDF